MRLINHGIIFLTVTLGDVDTTMQDAEKWAAGFAKKIADEQESTDQRERVALMKSDAVKARAPQLWDEVVAKLEEYAKAFNERFNKRRKLSCQRLTSHQFMVRPDALPEIVVATYFPSERRILVKSGREGHSYNVTARLHGSEVVVVLEEGNFGHIFPRLHRAACN